MHPEKKNNANPRIATKDNHGNGCPKAAALKH
jgi:hydroxymethylpyrimidine/phosphomethylpyrimidine kinase